MIMTRQGLCCALVIAAGLMSIVVAVRAHTLCGHDEAQIGSPGGGVVPERTCHAGGGAEP